MITEYGVRTTKKGEPRPYANFTLEDATGSIRATIWPEQYNLYARNLKSDAIVFIVGRIDRSRSMDTSSNSEESGDVATDQNDGNLIVNEVLTLEEAPERFTKGMVIALDEKRHNTETVKTLYEILRGYPGKGSLELSVKLDKGGTAILRNVKMNVAMNSAMRERVNRLLGDNSVQLLKAAITPPKETARRQWKRD
jgi:DNA polymerase III alpha subunit